MAKRHLTNVGKLVARKQPKLANKIDSILSKASKRIADLVTSRWMNKADAVDPLIQSILNDLELEGISIDLIDSITPELVRAFKEAGILGIGQVGVNASEEMIGHLDMMAMDYMEVRGTTLIKDLTETTRNGLRDVLTDGLKEGISSKQLGDRIEAMGEFGEARSNMIARTELAFAHVQGNVNGWKETGLKMGKRSILGDLHEHEDECDECADAGLIGIDEEFIPGYSFPPYHPNCICDVLPEILDEGDEDETE